MTSETTGFENKDPQINQDENKKPESYLLKVVDITPSGILPKESYFLVQCLKDPNQCVIDGTIKHETIYTKVGNFVCFRCHQNGDYRVYNSSKDERSTHRVDADQQVVYCGLDGLLQPENLERIVDEPPHENPFEK